MHPRTLLTAVSAGALFASALASAASAQCPPPPPPGPRVAGLVTANPTPIPTPSPVPTPAPAPAPTNPTPGTPGPTGATPSAVPTAATPATGTSAAPVRRTPGSAGVAPVTRRNRANGLSRENWHHWWNYNRDEFLNLKVNLYRQSGLESESPAFFLGRVTRHASDTRRPPITGIRDRVVPRLRTLLADDNREMRYRAAIALGRVGSREDIPYLAKLLEDPRNAVREAATIGLALLRDPLTRPTLEALLIDNDMAKALCHGHRIYGGTRGAAAVGLALLDRTDDKIVSLLLKHAGKDRDYHHVPMMSTIALGLVRGELTQIDRAVDGLLDLAKPNSNANAWARAQALVSVGRILQRNHRTASTAVIDKLVAFAKGSDVHQRRSAAIALGLIPMQDRARVVNVLGRLVSNGKDSLVRGFAAVSLGRIGGEAADAPLLKCLRRGRGQAPVFAAIGLGIRAAAMQTERQHRAARTKLLGQLRKAFLRERTPDQKGGYAIALGIAGDARAGGSLMDALKDSRDVRFRGDCAVAIGMIGHRASTDALSDMLEKADKFPRLKEHLAISLGLMGARRVVPPLLRSLKKSRSAFALNAVTNALGLVGDRSAVDPLLALLDADKKMTRLYACAALGSVGDPNDLPLLNAVRSNHNYLASCTELNHLLTTVNR